MSDKDNSMLTTADHSRRTADSSIRDCPMCCKCFKSSFFMNLNECGHIVCKVCVHDWNHKTGNQTCPVCKSSISERQLDVMRSRIQNRDDYPGDVYYEKVYHSSGGILVRRINGTLHYLTALQQLCNGDLQWVSPKGRIEGDESSLEAARREIAEEVGLKSITLIDFVAKQCYSYKESGKFFKKTVFWYLFDVDQPGELFLNEEEGFIKSKWITYEESLSTFTHGSFVELIKVADGMLNKN